MKLARQVRGALAYPIAVIVILVGVMVVLVTRIPSVVAAWQARRMAPVGQVALEEG